MARPQPGACISPWPEKPDSRWKLPSPPAPGPMMTLPSKSFWS